MHKPISVNLPVQDLKRSIAFFEACDSEGEVDSLVKKAVAAGGKAPRASQDHGFMYFHGFEDLDSHTWELAHMVGEPPAQ